MDDIGVFEAMYSQRQFTRYKSDPVPLDDIKKIFDAATKAPSGGNKQPWHFIAITERIERGRYASSVWLAVQNMFLAARALGLGTRITTTHLREEQKVKDWLGIPDHVETICLSPIGYPRGNFGPTNRIPSEDVTSYNGFGRTERNY